MLLLNQDKEFYKNDTIITVKCDYCKKVYQKKYISYLKYGRKHILNKDCCKNCLKVKELEIRLLKFNFKEKECFIDKFTRDKLPIVGIYKITNKINGRIYVGSSKNIFHRWNDHSISDNYNKDNYNEIHDDIKFYGIDNFEWDIVHCFDQNISNKELIQEEYKIIRHYKSYMKNFGYNFMYKEKKEISLINGEIRDISNKKRCSRKITKKEVIEIKQLIIKDIPLTEIALQFGVSANNVWSIKNGKTWKNVIIEDEESICNTGKYRRRGVNNPSSKLKEEDVIAIKKRIKNSETMQSIANDFSVSRTLIGKIKREELWSHI